ncbi:NH3-dependent NAD synthetase [Spironucleus salmonicida]|uniref:NH3-dependent NAD synthetase n=1 Tax=Spironucleus salmonicida TaxID=348837 RepID=V6LCG2_9EUKA|nr:NH3-dependent NAD synthetase [Spironucleus salmonicida]|eukprot:EST42160.1 NH3-dependent NAD synthetase [Spironucleus salmonicida]
MYKTKLSPVFQDKLNLLRKNRNFNAEQWVNSRCIQFNNYLATTPLKTVVVSVSGGIDSSVTFALANYAQHQPNSPIQRVLGVLQPIHSTAQIQDRALLLKDFGDLITVDQTEIFDSLFKKVDTALDMNSSDFARGNLRSYMRTPVAFYVAQMTNGCVVGTGNYDEDGFLYYFSKAGDGVSDVQLIHDLHKSEVYEVGRFLGLAKQLVEAVPSADLWAGQTDENEIGWSYDHVELITELVRTNELDLYEKTLSAYELSDFKEFKIRLFEIHERNKHKAVFPLNIK